MTNFFSIVKCIAIVAMVVIVFLFVISLLISIINYIDQLKEKTKEETNIIKRRSKMSVYTLDARVNSSISILNLTSDLVDKEVINTLKTVKTLKKRYELTNLDNDITTISKKVFDAINFKDISVEELTISLEYIMAYITDETTIKLINAVSIHNIEMNNN